MQKRIKQQELTYPFSFSLFTIVIIASWTGFFSHNVSEVEIEENELINKNVLCFSYSWHAFCYLCGFYGTMAKYLSSLLDKGE